MKKFLITETSKFKEPLNKNGKVKIKEINFNEKEKIFSKTSCYLAKNEQSFAKASHQVLNFMVDEETQFTDLLKIEDYFKSNLMKSCNNHNTEFLNIKHKEKELEDIEKQIQKVINFH